MSLNNLAWILATSPDDAIRNPQEAISLAKQLCDKTKFSEPVSLDTYAAALASAGQFRQAIQVMERAILLQQRNGQATDRQEVRIQLYRAGKPYIASQTP